MAAGTPAHAVQEFAPRARAAPVPLYVDDSAVRQLEAGNVDCPAFGMFRQPPGCPIPAAVGTEMANFGDRLAQQANGLGLDDFAGQTGQRGREIAAHSGRRADLQSR